MDRLDTFQIQMKQQTEMMSGMQVQQESMNIKLESLGDKREGYARRQQEIEDL